eukprot:sb/3472784/
MFGEGISEDAAKAYGGSQQLTVEKWAAINKTKQIMKSCPRDFEWVRSRVTPEIESYGPETSKAYGVSDLEMGYCLSRKQDPETKQILPIIEACFALDGRPKRDSARLTIWNELRIFDRHCLDWGWGEKRLLFDSCHKQGGAQTTKYNSNLKVCVLNLYPTN